MMRLWLSFILFIQAFPSAAQMAPRAPKGRVNPVSTGITKPSTRLSPAGRLHILQASGLQGLITSPSLTGPENIVPSVTPESIIPTGIDGVPAGFSELPGHKPATLPGLSGKALAPPAFTPVPKSLSAPAKNADPGALKEESDEDWARRMGEGPLNILIAGGESVPFIKTGGLADVLDALGRGFAERGHNTKLFLPKYSQIDEKKLGLTLLPGEFDVPVGDRIEKARLWHTKNGKADVYFIDNPNLYSQAGPYYPTKDGVDDTDDRFIFFSRAVIEAAKQIGFRPDIVHAHDWHAGLIPALLNLVYAADPFFMRTATVQTIHNIAYQGFYPYQAMLKAGFSPDDFKFDNLEYYGSFSFLKAGLVHADAITTVSPSYAKEIQENEEFGKGLQGLLKYRAKDLHGILNGLDPKLYDPATQPALWNNYSAADVDAGKTKEKMEMQSRLGLERNPKAPLFGIASRLADQKGIDLVIEMIPWLVKTGAQIVIVGSGDQDLEEKIAALARKHPEQVHLHPFSETFVHNVYAASDFLLMPSRFEPGGLSQLIAKLYGTLTIANRTGGLKDTIIDIGEDEIAGDGFFMRDMSVAGLVEAVLRAMALYDDKASLHRVRQVAMAKDSTWERPLDQYLALFRSLLRP